MGRLFSVRVACVPGCVCCAAPCDVCRCKPPLLQFGCLQKQSHLYKNVGAIVGAYLRIDIPKLPHFDQYNYVLFTGGCSS